MGKSIELNLIDTPGHVDFAYEVSRSLAACEGALLVVDAAQGVEAQTVANVHLAMKQGLTIVPVINKIDLPNADVPSVHRQLEEILAIPADEADWRAQRRGSGSRRFWKRSCIESRRRKNRIGRNTEGACLRFRVRRLPGRSRLCRGLFREAWKRVRQSS